MKPEYQIRPYKYTIDEMYNIINAEIRRVYVIKTRRYQEQYSYEERTRPRQLPMGQICEVIDTRHQGLIIVRNKHTNSDINIHPSEVDEVIVQKEELQYDFTEGGK